jgi:hypothetical protein
MSDSAAFALLFVLMASPLAICVSHAVLTRLFAAIGRSVAPQIVVLGTVILGNIPMMWFAWSVVFRKFAGDLVAIACGVALVSCTYNALGFCYFCLLNLSETSLHVHILMELLLFGPVRAEDLAIRYGVNDMMNARVERMIALGQIRSQNGLFVVNSRGLLSVGRIIHLWRRLLALPLRPI